VDEAGVPRPRQLPAPAVRRQRLHQRPSPRVLRARQPMHAHDAYIVLAHIPSTTRTKHALHCTRCHWPFRSIHQLQLVASRVRVRYAVRTCVALSTAPLARKSVMWLVRLKLPASQVPAGTCSVVPPRCRWCWMRYTALRNAHVFSVRPSPTPPKSAMDITSGRCLAGARPAHVAAAVAAAAESHSAAIAWSTASAQMATDAGPRDVAAAIIVVARRQRRE
jgi:hypothetical protein